jgi:hypothetical protein
VQQEDGKTASKPAAKHSHIAPAVTHCLCGLLPVLNMMRSADTLAPLASSTVQLLLLLLLLLSEPPAS